MPTQNIGSDVHIQRYNRTSDGRYDRGRYDMDRYDAVDVLDSDTVVTRDDLWMPQIEKAEAYDDSTGAPRIKKAYRTLR